MSEFYRIYNTEKQEYLPTVIEGKRKAEKVMKANHLKAPTYRLDIYSAALMSTHPEHKKLLGIK